MPEAENVDAVLLQYLDALIVGQKTVQTQLKQLSHSSVWRHELVTDEEAVRQQQFMGKPIVLKTCSEACLSQML